MKVLSLPIPKNSILEQDLCLKQAKDFVAAVKQNPYTKFLGCYTIKNNKYNNYDEYIEVELDIECPQYPVNDIKSLEVVGILFSSFQNTYPMVFALREGFPKVPHLNLMYKDFPKSLCIYEQPFEEQKAVWTYSKFIEDIRKWMKRTANNNLHQENQHLEPLVSYSGKLIVPKVFDENNSFGIVDFSNEIENIFSVLPNSQKKSNFILLKFNSEPQLHGGIDYSPKSLMDLVDFFEKINFDLIAKIKDWIKEESHFNLIPIIYLIIPLKTKKESVAVEKTSYAFFLHKNISEIGLELGILGQAHKLIEPILFPTVKKENLINIGVSSLKIVPSIDREDASMFNNQEIDDTKISLIGVGSLGSHVIKNCAHSGFGRWNIFDQDSFLPHNLARHILSSPFIGFEKSKAVSIYVNNILKDENFSKPHVTKIQKIETDEGLREILNKSNIILDCSASLATARFLSKNELKTKICSAFLNPSGTDLIIFCEDESKDISLDLIEMQYYKHLIRTPNLHGHLKPINEIHYVLSCRDKSSTIPQDFVALHASIASRKLKQLTKEKFEFAGIWHNTDGEGVSYHPISIRKIKTISQNNWSIKIDYEVIERIHQVRLQKLPVETGGMLLGTYDIPNKLIYITDFLLPPKDSEESPNSFLRGIKGVEAELEKINKITAGNIEYIGEWHSHPKNCSLNPSDDDAKLFQWIQEALQPNGYPPLMLIVGDKDINFLVEKINS